MRNDCIGLSIDGDHAARCNGVYGCQNNNGCGCTNRRPQYACGCENDRQPQRSCGCENDRQPQRSCGCENDRQPQRSCGCEDDRQPQHPCGCGKRTPGMVYAEKHDLDNLYCAQQALARGTLFACLDKPMCGDRCSEDACTDQCQEEKFAIWELQLYLNTHPCDKQALALWKQMTRGDDCGRWSWAEGPWPWEYQPCCGKEA